MRNLLLRSVFLMLAIAAICILWVLMQASQLPETPRNDLAVFDLSNIAQGEYRWLDCACDKPSKILLINDHEGKFYAYLLQTAEGRVVMPDGQLCGNFAPQTTAGRKLKHDAHIVCADTEQGGAWLLNGPAVTPKLPAMVSLQTERKGLNLYILGR